MERSTRREPRPLGAAARSPRPRGPALRHHSVRTLAVLASLAAALLLVAPPAAAGPLPGERETWLAVETRHFRLVSNASEADTAEIGLALERFRLLLQRLSPTLVLDSPVPTTILVFRNERSFNPYKQGSASRGGQDGLVGFFLSHPMGNFIAMNANPAQSEPLPVVFHEYTHYLLRHNLPFLPLWANEGLAEYYSTFRETPKGFEIGRPVRRHMDTLASRSMIPLERLFAVDTTSAEYNEREKKGIFYAQSWALMHYLLTGPETLRTGAMELLSRLSAGEDAATAVEESLDLGLGELERRLLGQARSRRFPFFRLETGELPTPAGYRAAPLGREKVLVHLGDLLAHSGPERLAAAAEHFTAALEIDPDEPEAHRGLGVVAREEGRLAEAEMHFARAVELGSRDARTYALYADLLLERLREARQTPAEQTGSPLWRRARELLRTARGLDSSFAEVEALLGSTWFYDPEGAAEGISHLARASSRLPDRPDIAYNLAMLYVKAGDLDAAHRVVQRNLVPGGHDELTREALDAIERNRLVRSAAEASARGEGETAVELYAEALARTDDPALVRAMEEELRALEALAVTNAQIERYNRAVELANRGELGPALEILRRLLTEVEDEDLRTAVRALTRELERALN